MANGQRALFAAVLILAMLLGGQAQAATPPATFEPCRVAVLPTDVDHHGQAEYPPDTGTRARNMVIELFDGRGNIEVLEPTMLDHNSNSPAPPCNEAKPSCQRKLAEALGVDFVVAPELLLAEEEFSASLALVARDRAIEPARFHRECTICSPAELAGTVGAVATDALVEILRTRATAPESFIDPFSSRSIATSDSPFTASASRRSTRRSTRLGKPSGLMIAGLTTAGAGLATTVGGTVLLALHGKSAGCLGFDEISQATKVSKFGQFEGCVAIQHNTAPQGGVLLGTGLALATAGVVMFIVSRRGKASGRTKAKAKAKTRVTAALSARGGGLRLRF
ncbi:MAG: hypothetical protein AAGF11_01150 [Myxococcota bacterium]